MDFFTLNHLPVRLIIKVYAGAVVCGFWYGAYQGFKLWLQWYRNRRRVISGLHADLVDPILNVGRDAGRLAFYFICGGGVSAVVVAGFPVTVPLLSIFSKTE